MQTKIGVISVVLTLASLSSLAHAQVFYPGPPKDFDPLTASDAERDTYGIPPRPDPSQTVLYEHWARMVTEPKVRLTNMAVETTNIVNGVARGRHDLGPSPRAVGVDATATNAVATTSENWSGVTLSAPNGTFAKNNSFVFSEFTVAGIGKDNCTYAPYAMSEWVGIDGWTSGDVLQTGIAATACGTSYVAWYEWFESGCTSSSTSYPCYQTNFSLPVHAGDYLAIEVWYTTVAPKGHAYIYNYTTKTAVSVGFNQPSGSATFEGNSAEWIVERPALISGGVISLENLANYLGAPSNLDYAYNGSSYYYSGSSPAGTTLYDVTMTCPTWNPSSACPSTTTISWPEPNGLETLWTFSAGPAQP